MKVGNTIEYYVPESVVGDHFNVCKGTVSTILPNDSLQEMIDVHFYIDGLIPITYGRPIQFKRGEWFNSRNCNFIVGDDKGANLRRISGKFSAIKKRATEELIASHQSKKTVNLTVHFITKLSLNLSIHISSLFVSLFEHYTHPFGKRRDPPKASSPEAKKLCKKKKEELSDPPYVPPEEVHKMIRKNKSNRKKHLKKYVLRMVWLEQSMLLRKSM